MASKFTYSEQSLHQIESLIPRLKHSVYPTKIISWLENFEEEDIPSAIDILRVFEYIPFNEFMSRQNDLLKELLTTINPEEKIIVFPFGKFGKSSTLVTYPLTHTTSFKDKEKDIFLTFDYKNIPNPSQYKHIIFIDDFIGSGNTFCEEYKTTGIKDWLIEQNISSVFILSILIMNEGKINIKKNYPTIKIISDVRYKLFDETYSPFKAFSKNTYSKVKGITEKYGTKINKKIPLGYDDSQSNIAFFHGTPNNTLPIIWMDKKWTPLYPRMSQKRMADAREFKKEIHYYLGVCDSLEINLLEGSELINKQINDKNTTSAKQNHALFMVLYLKNKEYENIFICQILAITREELRCIYDELKNKKLVTADYISITTEGTNLLRKLQNETNKVKIRKESNNNLAIKKSLYLPKSFEGMT